MNEVSELTIPTTPSEIVRIPIDSLMVSMSDVVQVGRVSAETLGTFLNEACEGIRIGNTDVVFVEQEHTRNLELDPSLESLARASGTKAILVEYFEPELKANARNFPVLGKLLEKVFNAEGGAGVKTNLSNKLAEIAKEVGKPIAVSDIANKAEYYFGYSLAPSGLLAASSVLPALLPVAITYTSMTGINRLHEFVTKKGHYDPEKIHQYEKILLDTEDARRVFAAMGIRQLVSEYQPKSSEPCRILACYPKAHSMRIANYLTDQGSFSRTERWAKQLLYRLYPAIDISVRQYQWKDTLARVTKDPSLAGWQQFSNRSL